MTSVSDKLADELAGLVIAKIAAAKEQALCELAAFSVDDLVSRVEKVFERVLNDVMSNTQRSGVRAWVSEAEIAQRAERCLGRAIAAARCLEDGDAVPDRRVISRPHLDENRQAWEYLPNAVKARCPSLERLTYREITATPVNKLFGRKGVSYDAFLALCNAVGLAGFVWPKDGRGADRLAFQELRDLTPSLSENLDVGSLGLSVRALNGLQLMQVWTVRDALEVDLRELVQLNNFGPQSLGEIANRLGLLGYYCAKGVRPAVLGRLPDLPPRPSKPPLNFPEVYLVDVGTWEVSARTANCLNNLEVRYVGDLIRMTEAELLRSPNFGRVSLNHVKYHLGKLGLQLGTYTPNWPPADLEYLARVYAEGA